MEREHLEVDVAVAGGGPAGLAAAIHLLQESGRRGLPGLRVAVLEKGADLGAHSLSGALLDPRGLDLLWPDWRAHSPPRADELAAETFLFLTARRAIQVPALPGMRHRRGSLVVSAQELVGWLGRRARELGARLFTGYAAAGLLWEDGRVAGIRSGDRGWDKEGRSGENFSRGPDLRARITLLADGAHGALSQGLIRDLRLDEERNPMLYAGAVKEVWRLPAGRVEGGRVWSTFGWPLSSPAWGGGFYFERGGDLVSLGFLAGLDSPHPGLDVHEGLQRLKAHPWLRGRLEGGECVAWGAKVVPQGGYWAIPRLAAPGALLLGDAGGLVNAARLSGLHLALESGRLAAETALDALAARDFSAARLIAYDRRVKDGLIGQELFRVRNFRQAFQGGLARGLVDAVLQSLTRGRGRRQRYPAVLGIQRRLAGGAFPALASPGGEQPHRLEKAAAVDLSGTRHRENQPSHLIVAAGELCRTRCPLEFGNPCTAFCPAGVFAMEPGPEGPAGPRLSPGRCVHCGICGLADPYGILFFVPPEGGDGPNYRKT